MSGRRLSAIVAVCILLILVAGHGYLLPSGWKDLQRYSENALRIDEWPRISDYDIVVAYYNEPLETLNSTIETIKALLPVRSRHRVIIYAKGESQGLLELAHEVVTLPNVGREGETYLNHISRHHSTADYNIALHTIFIQPHIAWDYVMIPRLSIMTPKTGFMSLGPYVNQTCGMDDQGLEFPRMRDIYTMFRGDFCPPITQLATWAGQFVVSRKRILDNDLRLYENLLDKFHVGSDHWIWREGWWNNEPANPTLGHALERTWPVIFDCSDGSVALSCGEGHGPTCQCLD